MIGFHERAVQRNAVRNAIQFHNGHAHHKGDFTGAVHCDGWFRKHAAGIGDERAGGRYGNLRCVFFVPERLTAEVHGEAVVRVAAQNLLKRDLIDDPPLIETDLPVGKDDLSTYKSYHFRRPPHM